MAKMTRKRKRAMEAGQRLEVCARYSLAQIATAMGVSKQAVQQLHASAMKKFMAHPLIRGLAVDYGWEVEEK